MPVSQAKISSHCWRPGGSYLRIYSIDYLTADAGTANCEGL